MKQHLLPVFASLLLASVAACGGSADSTSASPTESASTASTAPANFLEVTHGIYRGGHPDAAGVKYLKAMGIKTIVDLEVDDMVEATPVAIAEEELDAWKAGIKIERFPMSAFQPAVSQEFDDHIDAILATLRDDTKKPIYVHCKHGQDRTGLVVGIERVELESWSPVRAHDEMVKDGFHTQFLGLEEYFERKTGGVLP